MAIQVRRGNEADFDASKMLPGEWAVSLDTKYVRMCFAPGVCLRMATYESFENDMKEIQEILEESRNIQQAINRIQEEVVNIAVEVEDYSIMSKSYAVGGTGTRENEDVDNAKYYSEQAKHISQGGNGLIPLGTISFENLPTENILSNSMYNISNDFTSDERFVDGGGIEYGKGSNVYYTVNGKWDVLAASDVKGIKGSEETSYRQGNVTITKDNIGLGNVNNTSDEDKPISNAVKEAIDDVKSTIDAINSRLAYKDISNSIDVGDTGCTAVGYAENGCVVVRIKYPAGMSGEKRMAINTGYDPRFTVSGSVNCNASDYGKITSAWIAGGVIYLYAKEILDAEAFISFTYPLKSS